MYLWIYLYVVLIFMYLPKDVGEMENPCVRSDCGGNENNSEDDSEDSRGRQTLHITDMRRRLNATHLETNFRFSSQTPADAIFTASTHIKSWIWAAVAAVAAAP